MHDRVDVPKPPRVTLAGLIVQVSPVEGDTDDTRVTVPANELIELTLIIDVPVVPAIAATLTGLAVTEKSGTATV